MALNSSRQWIPLQRQLVPKEKGPSITYQKNIERRHKDTIESALKRGYLKCLDKDLILQHQPDTEGTEAATELQKVRRIFLDGSHVQTLDDFTLISCMNLMICNLASCFLRDISAFYGSINLIKLDVSNNQISQLPKGDFWSSLTSLRVLYLHGNVLSGREALVRLNACSTLHILTLYDTPLALIKNYRHHTVNSILSLRALDSYVISDEEIIENLRLPCPFRPLTKQFKVQLYISFPKGLSYNEEIREVYRVLLAVDRVLANNSPVILLQRHIRGWLVRKALVKSTNQRIRSLVARAKAATVPILKFQQPKVSVKSTAPQHTGVVVATEMQIAHRPPVPLQAKDKPKYRSLPPPPPSSPHHTLTPLPVERHVIGIDRKSSHAKYFMHINLRRLQQTVTEAELLEPEGVDKHFVNAFKKKSKRTTSSKPDLEDDHERRRESVASKTDVGAESSTDAKAEDDVVQISGSPVKILTRDQQPDLSEVKKKEGIEIREAEREILRMVNKEKEPLSIPKKPKIPTKDALLFTRAAATMTLSALQSAEQTFSANKKESDLLKLKASRVAKIRKDRVTRKAKIESFKRKIREQARDWKTDEDQRLEEQREKIKEKRYSTLLKQSEEYDSSTEKRLEMIESQRHAHEFGVQSTMVGSTLDREDYKVLVESEATEKKDVVRKAREQALEKQEMVCRYMELRRAKLLQEGEEARRKLDSKMLEAASNRLMSSKRRIHREIARKQAAREAIALARQELRKRPHRPGESQPSNQGPTIVTADSKPATHTQFSPNRTNSEFKSPQHARHHQSRGSHSTWQRGSRVLGEDEEGHFPLIRSSSETPLMYGMLQSGAKRVSIPELPTISSENSSSATSSMVTTKQLSVR